MNEVYTIDFTKPGGYPLKQDTLRVMQQTYSGQISALAKWHTECLPGVGLEAVVVEGLNLSPASGGVNVGEGWVAIDSLLVYVPAAYLAGGNEFSPLYILLQGGPDPNLDPAFYAVTGDSHDVHQRLWGVVSLSPTGLYAPLHPKRFLLRLLDHLLPRNMVGDTNWVDVGPNGPSFSHGPRPALVARVVQYLRNLPVTRVSFRGSVQYSGSGMIPTDYVLFNLSSDFRPSLDVLVSVGVRSGGDHRAESVRITSGGDAVFRPTTNYPDGTTIHFEGAGWMT